MAETELGTPPDRGRIGNTGEGGRRQPAMCRSHHPRGEGLPINHLNSAADMARETTLVLVKPDGMQRGLAGEILARFERRGLVLRAAKLLRLGRELAERHYDVHREKPFFGELVEFITSGPTLVLVLEGEGAIETCRKTIGATSPADAEPGSIRGDLALSMPDNLVHGSDSPEMAEREIALFFPDGLV